MASRNTRSVLTRVSVEDVDKAKRDLKGFGREGEQALKRLERAADKPSRSLMRLDKASKGTGTAISALGRQVALIDGPLGGVSSRFSAAASSVSNFGIVATGAAAGVAAIGFAMGASLRAANEYEKRMFTVGATLETTGFASGKTAAEIDKLAVSIGRATLAARGEVRDAANILLTFRSVAGDTFDRTLRLAQDLAAVGMGSITESTKQLGKALEDPVKGISALTRVGVSFTATQQEVIKGMAEAGDVAGAQALILNELERQVGGSGVGQAQGLAGAYDSLSENVGIFLEHMGRSGPIQQTTESMRGLAWVVQELDKVFFPDLNQQIENTLKKIQGARALGFLGPIFGVDQGELEAQLRALQTQAAAQRRESEERLRQSALTQERMAQERRDAKELADEKARAEKIARKIVALEERASTAGSAGVLKLGQERAKELKRWQRMLDGKEVSEKEFGRARVLIDKRYRNLIEKEIEKDTKAFNKRRVKWTEDLAEDQRKAYERTFEGGVARAGEAYFDDVSNAGKNAGRVITSAFGEVEDALTTFFMGAGISFDSFFESISKGLARLAAQDVIASIGGLLGIGSGSSGGLIGGIVGGIGSFVGGIFGFSGGGRVRGPGTGRSDSVPALLSNGEFVVNAQSARRHAPLLRAINADQMAAGGLIGDPIGDTVRGVINEVSEGRDPGSAISRGISRSEARAAAARERSRQEERALVEMLLFGGPEGGQGGFGLIEGNQNRPTFQRVRDMGVLDRIRRFLGWGRPGGFTGSSAAGGLISILGNLVKGLFKSSPIGLLASAVVSIGGNLAREHLTGGAAKSTGLGGMIYEHFSGGRPITRQVRDALGTFGERIAGAGLSTPLEGRDGSPAAAARFINTALAGAGPAEYGTGARTAFATLGSRLASQWSQVEATGRRVTPFQGGGQVMGPGTGASDSVPARLSNGEYVVNAASASQYGPMLDQINADPGGAGAGGLAAVLAAMVEQLDETNRLLRMMVTSGDLGRRTAFA